jgi:hypothetical protein
MVCDATLSSLASLRRKFVSYEDISGFTAKYTGPKVIQHMSS